MKKLLSILSILLFFTLTLNAQWTQQNSGTNEWLHGVDFFDANNGITIGANSTVLYTNNGGADWHDASGNSETDFYDVELENDTLGYLVGENAAFYQTKNGGKNWGRGNTDIDSTKTLRDIEIGSNGYFLSVNWTDTLYVGLHNKVVVDQFAYLGGTFIAYDISTTDNYVYVTGLRNSDEYNLYKAKENEVGSTSNWTKVSSFSVSGNDYDDFYLVDFPTDEIGYMAGSRGHGALGHNTACVEKTTDGGENFEIVFQLTQIQSSTAPKDPRFPACPAGRLVSLFPRL